MYQPPYAPPTPRGVATPVVAAIAVGCLMFGMLGGGVGGVAMSGAPSKVAAQQQASPTSAGPIRTFKSKAAAVVKKSKPAPVKKVKVPNVVGQNHQTAQDYLQSKGFFRLAEEDATGQRRLLIWNRNWQVVRQS